MVRNVLLAEIPTVLRAKLHAVPVLAAAAIVVIGHLLLFFFCAFSIRAFGAFFEAISALS